MKRQFLIVLLSIVCALCLAFGLAACNNGTTNGGTTDGEQNNEQTGNTDGGTEEDIPLEYTLTSSGDSYVVSGIGSVTSTTVTIPSTHNDKAVSAIGDSAFKDNTNITEVHISDSVTEIGAYAFYGCTSLTTVTIGSGVTAIGESAFGNCAALESVAISGNPEIASGAFSGCGLITEIKLSDELLEKLSEILSEVFADSESITEIKNNSGETYHNYEGYSYDENGHWQVCTICGDKTASESHTLENNICTVCGYKQFVASENLAYTISDDGTHYTVSGIGTCSDTDIVIPSTHNNKPVTVIAASAFKNQTQMTSVYVPNSVTSIGEGAFSGCSSLVSMTLPFVGGSVKTSSDTYQYPFGYIFGTTKYTDGTETTQWYYGSSTSSLTSSTYYIPATLTTVTITGGNILIYAFSSCRALTSITIPDNVTSIGYYAFYNCTALTSVILGSGVTSIGDWAFYNCTALESITIPDSVISIGSSAFYNTAYYNDSSNWEDNVLYIGDYLIKANTRISGSYTIKDGTTVIAGSAFFNCTALESVTIPDNVISIGDSPFALCTALTSISIPDSVTSIGAYAFYECCALESITIPDSVITIGDAAFYECYALESITIPDSVTSIGDVAFFFCSKLTSVIIGIGVTSIGWRAFNSCSKLTSVTFNNTSGWYVSTSLSATSGTDITSSKLSSFSTAAKYLTDTYDDYYWYRSES